MTQAEINNLKTTREFMQLKMYDAYTLEIKQLYKNAINLIDEKLGDKK